MDYPATNEKHSRRVAERTRLHEPLGMPAAFLSPSLERVCGVPFEPLGSQGTSPEGEPTAAPRGRMTRPRGAARLPAAISSERAYEGNAPVYRKMNRPKSRSLARTIRSPFSSSARATPQKLLPALSM